MINKSTKNKSGLNFQWNIFIDRNSKNITITIPVSCQIGNKQGYKGCSIKALQMRKRGFQATADRNPQNRAEKDTLSRALTMIGNPVMTFPSKKRNQNSIIYIDEVCAP